MTKRKIVNVIKEKRTFFNFIFFVGLLVSAQLVQNRLGFLRNLSTIGEGLQVCFSRIAQSHTATILGDGSSPYLQKQFMSQTEQCLGDTMALSEDKIGTIHADAVRKLNALSVDAHWFHEKILESDFDSMDMTAQMALQRNLNLRFGKLEELRNDLMVAGENSQGAQIESLFFMKMVLYLLAFVSLISMIWQLVSDSKRVRQNRKLEQMAKEELINTDLTYDSQMDKIISTALDKNDLTYCAQLFSSHQEDIQDGKLATYTMKPYHERVEPTEKPVVAVEAKRPVESEYIVENVEESTEKVNVTAVFSDVVDTLSTRLFTQGILFDLKVEGEAYVVGKEDAVQQILYHLIANAIDSCEQQRKGVRSIDVSLRRWDKFIDIIVDDSGAGFELEFFQTQKFGTGLTICSEFIKESGGGIEFENRHDRAGRVFGARVTATFKESPVRKIKKDTPQKGKLSYLKKGKKKDLIKELGRMS